MSVVIRPVGLKLEPGILTYDGQHFDFIEPENNTLSIETIAHALSNLCRFSGHTRRFYSVAQHSYLVSLACDPKDALFGLLHDAAEAFLGDISSPLKQLLPEYIVLEKRLEVVIRSHFKLPAEMPASVKYADMAVQAAEKRDLMPDTDRVWPFLEGIKPWHMWIRPWSPDEALLEFLMRYKELTSPQNEFD